jgi:two-component system, OmpR family, response regulator MprA
MIRAPADPPKPRQAGRRPPSLLVVEDQADLAAMLVQVLDEEGFSTRVAGDGREALEEAARLTPDLVVLDVLLPGLDGLAVCRELRARGLRIPVILLTARDAVPDRVAGLEAGADDYVVKPFAFEELVARIRAHLRRQGLAGPRLEVADLVLEPDAHRASRAGRPLALSPTEFRLLEVLMRHPGQVLSRETLLERVWGFDANPTLNIVDLYVHYLRRKVDRGFGRPLIQTVRSLGYVLRAL